jgi:Protein of unknown function (DUF3375)
MDGAGELKRTRAIAASLMDYYTLEQLRKHHPAWRLLNADHAPLIVSFLHSVFIEPNIRSYPQPELAQKLEDTLFHLNREAGERIFPRPAQSYLDDWALDTHAWLRKYYPPDGDVPHYDLTPAAELGIGWLAGLGKREFIGTQSRLLAVFDLLRQLIEGTETDPKLRIEELERKRAAIDEEIATIHTGKLKLIDDTGIKERFLLASQTARALLSDFRQVEQNFRSLDRVTRERIATWDGDKASLLDEIFDARDAIDSSDEGKSFRAFWAFLMSPARREELSDLLAKAFELEPVRTLEPSERLKRIHYDWLDAGESGQRTVARLSEQLRRYLDDKAWLENKRIMQLLREIEESALALRGAPLEGFSIDLDGAVPGIELAMDRPLFAPPAKPEIDGRIVLGTNQEIPAEALFGQFAVDRAKLLARIRRALQMRSQISLGELVGAEPLDHGLAELVAYMTLATEDDSATIDDSQHQTVRWTDPRGKEIQAALPLIIFARLRAVAPDGKESSDDG